MHAGWPSLDPLPLTPPFSTRSGKKFQKLKKQHDAGLDLDQYKPFLSDSLNFRCVAAAAVGPHCLHFLSLTHPNASFYPLPYVSGMLFCSLTNQLIAKDKAKIEAHIGGRRYQNAQSEYTMETLGL